MLPLLSTKKLLSFQTSKTRQSVRHIPLQNVGGPDWCAPCPVPMMNPTTRLCYYSSKNLDPENVDGEGQRKDNQQLDNENCAKL